MDQLLKLFIIIAMTFSCSGNLAGTLSKSRQVNAGLYIHSITNNSYNEGTPSFTVKAINDTPQTVDANVVCTLRYQEKNQEEVSALFKLYSRQWRKIRFVTEPSMWRTRATCSIKRRELDVSESTPRR